MMVYQVDSQAMSGEGAAAGALRRDAHLPLHRRRHLLLEDLLDLGGVRVRLGVHVGDDGDAGRRHLDPCQHLVELRHLLAAGGCEETRLTTRTQRRTARLRPDPTLGAVWLHPPPPQLSAALQLPSSPSPPRGWRERLRRGRRQGRAEQSRAGQGRAGQGRAGQGRAGQGRAGQGRAGQGRAGQGAAPPGP